MRGRHAGTPADEGYRPLMDLSLALMRRGYRALPEERERRGGADTFATRLLGRRAVVLHGRKGVRFFYDESLVSRVGAVPPPVAGLIFGSGAMHGLDGAEHRHRKALFLDLLDRAAVAEVSAAAAHLLRHRLEHELARVGPDGEVTVDLFDVLVEVYGDTVLRWAGVPASDAQRLRLAHRMAAIVDGFGGAGTAYARGWRDRLVLDRWATRVVRDVRRAGRGDRGGDDTPLGRIAALDLPARTAGVELLNLLRPTVAVAWPATWAAVETVVDERRSEIADGLRGIDADRVGTCVAHESRRVRPFVPALAGKVRRATTHDGVRLEPGERVVLDVAGTNVDPAWWTGPGEFDPTRFDGAEPDPYAFVPQGGGDPSHGHRCPGEPLTVALVRATLAELARVELRAAPGGREQPLTRMPRRPATRVVLRPRG
ncbi:fatty-acid peroxygenase [Nocardioides zeae]|uniref:Fatty-acid peroxygenase n=1 Tax=Nocardioides zeae TaxID=1457234 RepID=A0ACC6IFD8_9ACTN|nr:fatty-acid peroxygenase [Nocardioides zeae]MDR6209389.1 fatty-acid peroxygenase [Nocardioides zeae]